MNTTVRPASAPQRKFIETLLTQRDTTGTTYEGWTPDWTKATSTAASAVIDYLLTLPKASVPATTVLWDAPEPEAGIYSNLGSVGAGDTTMIRVYNGQQSGRMLAKEIVTADEGTGVEYRYLGRAVNHIGPSFRRLPLSEVGALGQTFNHCLICGRRLDDPESVDRGIGPVCAAKY